MREIKFRAWVGYEMLFSGGYTSSGESFDYLDFHPRTGAAGRIIGANAGGDPSSSLEDFELMQYTGLKDKNGVEIYEGDKVKGAAATATIEWDKDQWIVSPIASNRFACRLLEDYPDKALEVIGNIYENPELRNRVDDE